MTTAYDPEGPIRSHPDNVTPAAAEIEALPPVRRELQYLRRVIDQLAKNAAALCEKIEGVSTPADDSALSALASEIHRPSSDVAMQLVEIREQVGVTSERLLRASERVEL